MQTVLNLHLMPQVFYVLCSNIFKCLVVKKVPCKNDAICDMCYEIQFYFVISKKKWQNTEFY